MHKSQALLTSNGTYTWICSNANFEWVINEYSQIRKINGPVEGIKAAYNSWKNSQWQ